MLRVKVSCSINTELILLVQRSLTIAKAEHLMETMHPINCQGQAVTSSTPQTLLATTSHHHNVFKTGICRSQEDKGPNHGLQVYYKNIFTSSSHFMKKLKDHFKAILDTPHDILSPNTATRGCSCA